MMYRCIAKCIELDIDNSKHCIANDRTKSCPVGDTPIWIDQTTIISVDLDERLKEELCGSITQLYELFNIAYDLNQSENTRTAFTQKTTTYLGGIIQTLQYIEGQLE